MKKFFSLGLVMLLLVTSVALTPLRAEAQGAGLVNSIVKRMERNRQSLRSMRANISMEKYNAQINDKDKYSGDVLYMPDRGRNAFVRVEWRSPQQETLAVANGKYTLFRPRLNMAYQGSATSSRSKVSGVLGFGLNVSSSQLASNFETPQYIGEETLWGGVRTWHLKLIPKGRAGYKYAEIWVDFDGMPVQTKVVERNDDSTTVRLMNIQRNPNLSKDAFTLQLGSNVKIVRG